MATATVSVVHTAADDAALIAMRNDFCAYHKYSSTIPDPADPDGPEIPNPESKMDFIRRLTAQFHIDSIKAYRANDAADTAREAELAKEINVA